MNAIQLYFNLLSLFFWKCHNHLSDILIKIKLIETNKILIFGYLRDDLNCDTFLIDFL